MAQRCGDLLYAAEMLRDMRAMLGPELKAVTGDAKGIDDVMARVEALVVPLETAPFDFFDRRYQTSWEAAMGKLRENVTAIEEMLKKFMDDSFTKLRTAESAFELLLKFSQISAADASNKQDVGRRFALLALKNDYGKSVVSMGPRYKSFKIEGNQISIQFEQSESPLATRDGKTPSHFLVAGEDKVFHAATEVVMKDAEVVVHSEKVSAPKAVRFAFDNISVSNLMNQQGLPAFSFRTDRW